MSQTLLKRAQIVTHGDKTPAGFHAELAGWDLPTLLQMACARGERVCVEVRSKDELGHIYMNEGRVVHASVGTLIGETAVALMLRWPGGSFALCHRSWPLKPSIDASADLVLLRAAQAQDEAERKSDVAPARRVASAFALERPNELPMPEKPKAPELPPPTSTRREGPVIASVRIDMNGEIVAQNGNADVLAPLVGYVARMGALLGPQLGLEPFEALAADLGKRRALVFVEGDEMVGLLLPPGALQHELRQQLGL